MAKKIIQEYCTIELFKVFSNATKALHYIKDQVEVGLNLPDIIFLDINLPGMDGYEFLEKLYSLKSIITSKVITISNMWIREEQMLMIKDKVNYMIDKPLTRNKLNAALKSIYSYT